MYTELMAGYEADVATHLSRTFNAEGKEMVLEKDIVFYSMCEHHMMPFFGKAHIAYIPKGKVVGLSKLARTVEAYARRLQIQERMTDQIADAIMKELDPEGVMVMIEAEHLCMTMRGVKKPGSKTTTVVTKGVFKENERLEGLFFKLLNRPSSDQTVVDF
jgi:GTP cyclohydrolase I